MKKNILLTLFLAVFAVANASNALSAEKINKIIVDGNQRIETDTILSYMYVNAGDDFNAETSDRSLKRLFETGFFTDVYFEKSQDNLIVHVLENPIINRRFFEGNNRVEDKILEGEVILKPRAIYTRSKVQEDVSRIIDIYKQMGRFSVKVEPKVIQRPQNRVDIIYEIDEGETTYIRKINFIGNKHFSPSDLKDILMSKEERWYHFLSSNETYDAQRLDYDKEMLRRFYLKNGYADFEVKSAIAEITPEKDAFFITISINEGEKYKFAKASVVPQIEDLKNTDFSSYITFAEGDTYNADKVESSIQKITDYIGTLGYAFVDVYPDVDKDEQKRTIAITFKIKESEKVYVNRININGNVRTMDKVVRREMRISEGDAFNAAKIRKSRQDVQDLGFFEKVDIKPQRVVGEPDKTDVNVELEEKSTGSLSIGAGWSTQDGALLQSSIQERNLLGKGQTLTLSGTLATKKSDFDIGFVEPYFLDRKVKAGANLFVTSRDWQDESSYDLDSKGFSVHGTWDYGEELSHKLSYTLKQDKISNVDDDASTYIKEQEGESVLSSIGNDFSYDKRNSKLNPSEGYLLTLGVDLAGFGGDAKFVRTDVHGTKYYPVADDTVLKLHAGGGYIVGIGDDVGIAYRYNLGGNSLRGFEKSGISPRDNTTQDSIGGNWILYGGSELTFPIGFPDELGVSSKLFVDVGMIGEPDNMDATKVESSTKPRLSIGTGLLWKSPMGPINIDVAFPIIKEDFDKDEVLSVNFGTKF